MTEQQNLISTLKSVAGDDEFASNQYPDTKGALKEFLEEKGFSFKEEDFIITTDELKIDDDGYPQIDQTFLIRPARLAVKLIGLHHSHWDFYIEDCFA